MNIWQSWLIIIKTKKQTNYFWPGIWLPIFKPPIHIEYKPLFHFCRQHLDFVTRLPIFRRPIKQSCQSVKESAQIGETRIMRCHWHTEFKLICMNDNNKDFLELKERDRHGCYTQRCLFALEQVLLCTIKLSGFYQEADHNNSHKFLWNFNHALQD